MKSSQLKVPLHIFLSVFAGWLTFHLLPFSTLVFGPEYYSWGSAISIALPQLIASTPIIFVLGTFSLTPIYLFIPRTSPFCSHVWIGLYGAAFAGLTYSSFMFCVSTSIGMAILGKPAFAFQLSSLSPQVFYAFAGGAVSGVFATYFMLNDKNPTMPSSESSETLDR